MLPDESLNTPLLKVSPLGSPCTTNVVRIPSPAGIVPPAKSNPITTPEVPEVDTVNPASAAAPPEALRTVGPPTTNWNPAIFTSLL